MVLALLLHGVQVAPTAVVVHHDSMAGPVRASVAVAVADVAGEQAHAHTAVVDGELRGEVERRCRRERRAHVRVASQLVEGDERRRSEGDLTPSLGGECAGRCDPTVIAYLGTVDADVVVGVDGRGQEEPGGEAARGGGGGKPVAPPHE